MERSQRKNPIVFIRERERERDHSKSCLCETDGQYGKEICKAELRQPWQRKACKAKRKVESVGVELVKERKKETEKRLRQ